MTCSKTPLQTAHVRRQFRTICHSCTTAAATTMAVTVIVERVASTDAAINLALLRLSLHYLCCKNNMGFPHHLYCSAPSSLLLWHPVSLHQLICTCSCSHGLEFPTVQRSNTR